MVEATGVEPVSKSIFTKLSPSAAAFYFSQSTKAGGRLCKQLFPDFSTDPGKVSPLNFLPYLMPCNPRRYGEARHAAIKRRKLIFCYLQLILLAIMFTVSGIPARLSCFNTPVETIAPPNTLLQRVAFSSHRCVWPRLPVCRAVFCLSQDRHLF